MNKRIIKKHMKNGLSRNRLERINRELEREIYWKKYTIDTLDREIEDMETEYSQLAELYRKEINTYVKSTESLTKKIENREKINEGLKNTIEDMMKTRYEEREVESKLIQQLDEEIKCLYEINKAMNIEIFEIRQKEEQSGAIKKAMRRVFNL